MAQTYEKGTLYQISIIDFKPDPDQPRKVIDLDAPQQGAGIDAKNSRNEYDQQSLTDFSNFFAA